MVALCLVVVGAGNTNSPSDGKKKIKKESERGNAVIPKTKDVFSKQKTPSRERRHDGILFLSQQRAHTHESKQQT